MNFVSCFFSISKAFIGSMYSTIDGVSIPANAIGWRRQPGYFILNISKIICEDLQTDSLANNLVSKIISVEIILELIDLLSLTWAWFQVMNPGWGCFFENSFVQSRLNRNLEKLLEKIFLSFKGLNWDWGFSYWYIS